MIATPASIEVPLRTDAQGKIRVGETRILLELLIHAFRRGESAEEIVDSYPTLKLGDVYAVLAYYLSHRSDVDSYVTQVDEAAEQLQRKIEQNYTPETLTLRARLRAQRDEQRHSTT